jgi:hypothetical protein
MCNYDNSQSNRAGREAAMNGLTPLKEILERQFPKEQIKHRKGSYGKMLSYVPAVLVVDRLNEAFNYKWNWQIVSHEINNRQIICIGRLTVKIDGETIIKEAFGSKQIEFNKGTETPVNDTGDDLKAACSDALKKAASLLGIGLHLYRDKPQVKATANNNGNGGSKLPIQVNKYAEYSRTLKN